MKILIISRSVFSNNPQAIRFRKFFQYWKKDNDISILTFKDNIPTDENTEINNLKLYSIKKNRISRKITTSLLNKTKKVQTDKYGLKKYRQLFKYRKLLFPDVYLFTLKGIKRKLKEILKNETFDVIIISAFPFSFLSLGGFIRWNLAITNESNVFK